MSDTLRDALVNSFDEFARATYVCGASNAEVEEAADDLLRWLRSHPTETAEAIGAKQMSARPTSLHEPNDACDLFPACVPVWVFCEETEPLDKNGAR